MLKCVAKETSRKTKKNKKTKAFREMGVNMSCLQMKKQHLPSLQILWFFWFFWFSSRFLWRQISSSLVNSGFFGDRLEQIFRDFIYLLACLLACWLALLKVTKSNENQCKTIGFSYSSKDNFNHERLGQSMTKS